ncbi:MAG TPA: thioredoxin domain-containing protein, partial [Gemmataceae bacterium]|nr:thioredoxin domain-containing protein [Gemmataceae bacterium]
MTLRTSLHAALLFIAAGALVLSADAAPADTKGKDKGKANRLAKESSPYLLQHAHNPVDWYPWGQEAFDRAKKEKKLIFLSIGYSSCHWCHVMERESFSSADIAKTLNENFVCIKVDREERPDIDDVYMTALNVVGESGGWPLTMFLTPEGKPIFGGTYFPPEDKKVEGGTIPGIKSVLKKVLELVKNDRAELDAQADKIAEMTVDSLERNSKLVPIGKLDREMVNTAAGSLNVDPEHGGIGDRLRKWQQAKFPRAAALSLLLHQGRKPGNEETTKLVALTLRKMAEGGIYDQLGGGFHRYSTERTWTVPHFEKMLYDNAQLVELYSDAYRATPDPLYKRAVAESLAFVAREMTSPEGAFYSALDADSNGVEGEFYVWTPEELKSVLGADADVQFFKTVYAAEKTNFEGKFHILRLPKPTA